jgi:hypothetical protein
MDEAPVTVVAVEKRRETPGSSADMGFFASRCALCIQRAAQDSALHGKIWVITKGHLIDWRNHHGYNRCTGGILKPKLAS